MTFDSVSVDDDIRSAFDRCLARADEAGATALVLDLLGRGFEFQTLLLDLIVPAQAVVGARWAANEWSLAQEYAAFHIVDQAISALAAVTTPVQVKAGSVVVACPDGEWHSSAARVVTEILRIRGFATHFLGASVPTAQLVSYLHQHDCAVVAISCTLPTRLPRAFRAIQACRLAGVPVLAGGPGFGPEGVWARTLGADVHASSAVDAADGLMQRWPPPMKGQATLDHLADGEYARLTDCRGKLLDGMLLSYRDNRSSPSNDAHKIRDLIVENFSLLLDNLETAVFVGDARPLTSFLDFTADLLAARGVAAEVLILAVQTLNQQIGHLHRTIGYIDAGRGHLMAKHAGPNM